MLLRKVWLSRGEGSTIKDTMYYELTHTSQHGQLEVTTEVSEQTGAVFARLVQLLYDKQVLTKADIFHLLPGYEEVEPKR